MASGGIDSSLLWSRGREGLAGAYTIEWPQDAGGEGLDQDAQTVRTVQAMTGSPVTFLAGDDSELVDSPLFPSFNLPSLVKWIWQGRHRPRRIQPAGRAMRR